MSAAAELISASNLTLTWHDWVQLFLHYIMLSLLSVGGAISTLPEMHRYLVTQNHYLSETQFNASVSIAQAAPGPNILFVALMGWQVGMNMGHIGYAFLGMSITMLGILFPSTTLTYFTTRWLHKNRDLISVKAFKLGMSPVVCGLLLATAYLIASSVGTWPQDWHLGLASIIAMILVWRTKIHILWLLAAGAVLGWFGVI